MSSPNAANGEMAPHSIITKTETAMVHLGPVDSVRNALTRLPGGQIRQVVVGCATVRYYSTVTVPN